MSQNDFQIANDSGAAVRADLNSALQALATLSSGNSAPSTTYAGQLWWDTGNDKIKIRNAANDGWVDFAHYDGVTYEPIAAGSDVLKADPEHATDSATDTYASATNTTPPADGVQIVRDFQSANTTTIPTLDGKTLTTKDGSALWAGAVSGVHALQRDETADTYLVLEPAFPPNPTVQTFTSSGTWNRPAGCRRVVIEVLGAGGGGGSSDATNASEASPGGGGGSGEYARKVLDVTSISSSTITIGSGGSGGAAGNNSGSAGGNSSWADGTNTVSANGGSGGNNAGNDGNQVYAIGGSGGSGGSGGDMQAPGAPGGFGSGGGASGRCAGGHGGSGAWGGGGQPAVTGAGGNDPGDNARNYGSGGGGGATGGNAGGTAGGDGSDGIVVVKEFY